ncbi:Na/Pi cotransporter family protein [candidate division CSSED10-310 bacterium]|uniref:Na/Pi cotransporter family protein n=1 Tax=candidate division CSSED10-310 bacterium TaxID=2855610 RepID=A0ABV6Z1N6_UNCC1
MAGNLDFWKLLAGLGIFLFGMLLLEESLRAISGKSFRRIIRQYTNSRLKAIGSGTLVTAILQSSSAVSLMVLAFVGAGVMSMENAIGVMMGSNIGTTCTAWIVAYLGFKIKFESFALPLIGIGGIALIFLSSYPKLFHSGRLLIGFGFMFLGLDYMKGSVESFTQSYNLDLMQDYGLWVYLLLGMIIAALMHSSFASIAMVLTALNSQLITFNMGVAMVIGANVGTTITILLGSIGGVQSKKRVGFSHLIFNVATAIVAFLALPVLVWIIKMFVDIQSNSVIGLALFHTLFNSLGVILFFPFMGLLSHFLLKLFPDRKTVLSLSIDKTPTEVPDAAIAALRNEIKHMLIECQFYSLRLLKIDENLVFDHEPHFEKNVSKKLSNDSFYDKIKLLHAEIFTFYARLLAHKLDENEAKELERIIYASRNMMNSIKNLKGIQSNLDEFDGSENHYLNSQYKSFRKRLIEHYHHMNRIHQYDHQEDQYQSFISTYGFIEKADKLFIKNTLNAISKQEIHEIEIASLFLVNRLFTQTCRLQIFSLKDLLLTQDQINQFDRTQDQRVLNVPDTNIGQS